MTERDAEFLESDDTELLRQENAELRAELAMLHSSMDMVKHLLEGRKAIEEKKICRRGPEDAQRKRSRYYRMPFYPRPQRRRRTATPVSAVND